MSEWAKSTPEFDKAISECVDSSRLQEIIRNHFDRDGAAPEPPAVPVPAPVQAPQTHIRVVYPSGNNRFEVYGASEAELDEKERQIRAMFGGQR
jgi:hypothetical protein